MRKVDAPCFVVDKILHQLIVKYGMDEDYLSNNDDSCMCRAIIGDTLFSGYSSGDNPSKLSYDLLEYLCYYLELRADDCVGYLAGPKAEVIAKAIETATKDLFERPKSEKPTLEKDKLVYTFLRELNRGKYTENLDLNP